MKDLETFALDSIKVLRNMNFVIKNFLQTLFNKIGFSIVRLTTLQRLQEDQKKLDEHNKSSDVLTCGVSGLLLTLPVQHSLRLLNLLPKSKSQNRQELFVLSYLDFKENGYFVEFGATNGIDLSNTHLLEKEFGWSGILVEPARCCHDALKRNRSAHIETSCVWHSSNSIVKFNEVYNPDLSTINSYSACDMHKKEREKGKIYEVDTISLNDLLVKYNAPQKIDFLSIDTEGSEYEILEAVDFNKYKFEIIVCEHNYTPMREKIYSLLSQKGYVRKYEKLSLGDDWFVKE